jgi:hypothetical protein
MTAMKREKNRRVKKILGMLLASREGLKLEPYHCPAVGQKKGDTDLWAECRCYSSLYSGFGPGIRPPALLPVVKFQP